MKKFFLAAVAAFVVAGLVFVACQKESINTEEVAINQSDKQQKSDGTEVIENYPIALSPDDYPFAYAIADTDAYMLSFLLCPMDDNGLEICNIYWIITKEGNMIYYGNVSPTSSYLNNLPFSLDNPQGDVVCDIIKTKNKTKWLEFIEREVAKGKEIVAWKKSDGTYVAISYERNRNNS